MKLICAMLLACVAILCTACPPFEPDFSGVKSAADAQHAARVRALKGLP